jgi:hypothetical protein
MAWQKKADGHETQDYSKAVAALEPFGLTPERDS